MLYYYNVQTQVWCTASGTFDRLQDFSCQTRRPHFQVFAVRPQTTASLRGEDPVVPPPSEVLPLPPLHFEHTFLYCCHPDRMQPTRRSKEKTIKQLEQWFSLNDMDDSGAISIDDALRLAASNSS